MEQGGLQVQRVVVSVGFLCVAAGQIPFVGIPAISAESADFFWVVSALGWVAFGAFSWVWLSALSRRRSRREGMRWALASVAGACLVLGVAYVGLVNELIELHRRLHYPVLELSRQAVAYGLSLVGFASASLGFGSAARSCETPPPRHDPAVEAVGAR